jgi:hypothetical protein
MKLASSLHELHCAMYQLRNDALWVERNTAGAEISSLPVMRYLPRGAFQPVFVTIAAHR